MTYIEIEDVRRASGDFESKVSDARITTIISDVEAGAEKWLNTVFTPRARIDVLDGNGFNHIVLDKNPVLRINSIKSYGTTITPAYVHVYQEQGLLVLDGSAEVGKFTVDNRSVIVSYLFGYLEEDTSVSTTLSTATTAGTSVAMTVASSTGFTNDDWVVVYGTDGNKEVAQISGVGTGVMTADQFSQAHAAASIITKLRCPKTVVRYLEVEAAIQVVSAILGATATDITHYSIDDFEAFKGEAYAQWSATFRALIEEREILKSRMKTRIYAVV
jgi:hypothetical protein